jgi:hypothetical protein
MDDSAPLLLKIRDAAGLMFPDLPNGRGPRLLYRWVSDGVIPERAVVRVGKAIYLRRAVLVAWLEGRQPEGGDAAPERGPRGH